jgi:hypothetical protein
MLGGQFEGTTVATGEKFVFIRQPPLPDRAHGMDDESGGQIITLGEFCRSGRTAAQPAAFLDKLRTGGTVDGTIDTAPAQQGRVGGIDDGIESKNGDVANDDAHPFHRFKSERRLSLPQPEAKASHKLWWAMPF